MDYTTHITSEGETWSFISYVRYGTYEKTGELQNANPGVPATARLDGGITLLVPVLTEDDNVTSLMPPWKQ